MAVEYIGLRSKWKSTKSSPHKEISWPLNEVFKILDIRINSVTFGPAAERPGFKQSWTIDRSRFLDCFVEVPSGGYDL